MQDRMELRPGDLCFPISDGIWCYTSSPGHAGIGSVKHAGIGSVKIDATTLGVIIATLRTSKEVLVLFSVRPVWAHRDDLRRAG